MPPIAAGTQARPVAKEQYQSMPVTPAGRLRAFCVSDNLTKASSPRSCIHAIEANFSWLRESCEKAVSPVIRALELVALQQRETWARAARYGVAAEDAAEVPLCFKCADTRVPVTVCARLSAAAQSAVAGSFAAHARRPWPWRSPAGARRSFRG